MMTSRFIIVMGVAGCGKTAMGKTLARYWGWKFYDGLQIVYLKGNYDLIWSRLSARQDHYMKAHMLQSQFEALEEPTNELSIDVSVPVDEVIQTILKYMEN